MTGNETHTLSFNEFEIFFRESFQAACLVAFRFIDDRSLVEDIVQESYITLWEKRSEIFYGREELKKYLLVTVRNRTISYLRSIKIKQVDLNASLAEISQPNEEKLFDDEELSIRISKAIKKLPNKCREIFLMAYLEDHTYNDIAKRLSISKNTVKTQMAIAYRILREELKELYFDFLFLVRRKKIH
ncbi:MAG: hypothetical protein A2W90_21185 [Bacteroidetes bacterium GWF2_42_66]|nr:MAG: hypothetical protein A2W92_00870 [Bacteroidetes bacterium GWA2_42_15]OFX99246.1 MAG: hypothetical protein A2W89_03865 [Bacteroidetes bacterium GWE2_42_39]OFY40643.1 MAG: hypothetical protein A2W90_21185 [Bacteroidetes bacterium GWF2_42_66]HAZ03304.1 hypothetical protein [Marinilabiliales bacterium]HBL76598.1 hypothetical protein [Prolixibacteraceae bacterium]